MIKNSFKQSVYLFISLACILFGAISAIPALGIQILLDAGDKISTNESLYHTFFYYYFIIAFSEEFSKYIFLILVIYLFKYRRLTSLMGALYGLGFAMFEWMYSGHSDYFYIPIAIHILLAAIQVPIINRKKSDPLNIRFYYIAAFVFAWIIHGTFDLYVAWDYTIIWASILAFLFIILLYILLRNPSKSNINNDNEAIEDFGFFR